MILFSECVILRQKGIFYLIETEYKTVAMTDEIPVNKVRCFVLDGHAIAVCNVKGEYHAVENKCSHGDSTFEKSRLRGHRLLCPLHGAIFDVRDGSVVSPPAILPIKTYTVKVEDNEIKICL